MNVGFSRYPNKTSRETFFALPDPDADAPVFASGPRCGLLLRDGQTIRPFPLSISSPGFTGPASGQPLSSETARRIRVFCSKAVMAHVRGKATQARPSISQLPNTRPQ